jgi:hypothetical protein
MPVNWRTVLATWKANGMGSELVWTSSHCFELSLRLEVDKKAKAGAFGGALERDAPGIWARSGLCRLCFALVALLWLVWLVWFVFPPAGFLWAVPGPAPAGG